MMAGTLKACPFCGASAVVCEHENMPILGCFGYFPESYYSVGCSECQVSLTGFESVEEAVSAWNRRNVHDQSRLDE